MIMLCPKCRTELSNDGKRMFCAQNHSYDISRHGYVNLLPPSSHKHGDNAEMISSRSDFLSSGIYKPLLDALSSSISEALGNTSELTYLDAGCGEGYYLEKISSLPQISNTYAVDISVNALRFAHKRDANISYIAASVYNLPIKNSSIDILTNIFSPYAGNEFQRVLKNKGHFFCVIPGRYHLFALKQLVYEHPYENIINPYEEELFDFIASEKVDYEVTLDEKTALTLWKMTPYYYRTPRAGIEKLENCGDIKTPISFEILHYTKK